MKREPHNHDSSLNFEQAADKELIRRTLGGEKAAFDALITRYRDRIYSLAYHMLANVEEAEDIAQEVFVRAYKNLVQFRQESGFYTWLYRIAVNIVYTQAKKNSRRRTLYQAAFREMDVRHAQVFDNPEREAQSSELREMILRAIHQLDPRFRQVIILKELEGLDVSEVAHILGLPEGTVKSRLFRAREDLKRLIQSSQGKHPEAYE
ncbi:sigma-70 family RNA polymerase sigma factor [candidate division FCPU426 bacterium]|nr:sigma-70 family RNA polymerase sigma factor [candidate division FCPU426 bacterium]